MKTTKVAKHLKEQEKLRKARKIKKIKQYAERKQSAADNPTPKLPKSFRVRFRNQVQLVENDAVYAPVARLRLTEKYGDKEFLQQVLPQLLKRFSEDEQVQKAVNRRKGIDDAN